MKVGETVNQAARRESYEEAGIPIDFPTVGATTFMQKEKGHEVHYVFYESDDFEYLYRLMECVKTRRRKEARLHWQVGFVDMEAVFDPNHFKWADNLKNAIEWYRDNHEFGEGRVSANIRRAAFAQVKSPNRNNRNGWVQPKITVLFMATRHPDIMRKRVADAEVITDPMDVRFRTHRMNILPNQHGVTPLEEHFAHRLRSLQFLPAVVDDFLQLHDVIDQVMYQDASFHREGFDPNQPPCLQDCEPTLWKSPLVLYAHNKMYASLIYTLLRAPNVFVGMYKDTSLLRDSPLMSRWNYLIYKMSKDYEPDRPVENADHPFPPPVTPYAELQQRTLALRRLAAAANDG